MTLSEVTHQIHNLAVSGEINGLHFSKQELLMYANKMLRTADSFIFQIVLPDGEWLGKISRYSGKADGYDYYIPETREAEKHLKEELENRNKQKGDGK